MTISSKKPLDWTQPIELAATDWQCAIPAEVVTGPERYGEYRVRILAPHQMGNGGPVLPHREVWRFYKNGECCGFPCLRIVNRTPVEPAATDWQSAAKAAGWTPPVEVDPLEQRARGVLPTSDWNEELRGPRMSDATGKVIFKYQMPVLERFTMTLPAGAQIIRMEDQGGLFWLWAVVDTDAPLEERHFHAYKTGAAMDANAKLHYVGFCAVFVQMELGLYIFEVMP